MGCFRILVSLLAGAAIAWGARDTGTVDQAVARVEQLVSQSPAALRPAFRMLAAQALKDRYPDLAAKFVRAVLDEVRTLDGIDPQLLSALAAIAPDETIALLPHLKPGSDQIVIRSLSQSNHALLAAALYRASFGKGQPRVNTLSLFIALSRENPDEAKSLFGDLIAAFSFERATPLELNNLIICTAPIAAIAPSLAADVYERIVATASPLDYGKEQKMSANFQVGAAKIATTNSRDTLLVVAGAKLRALAPQRFEGHKDVLRQWDLSGPVSMKGMTFGTPPVGSARPPAEVAISDRLGKLRSLPDDERAKTVLELAREIQALPTGSKSGWASSLASLATEGDNGKEALNAVAAALGQGIQEDEAPARAYLELASLIRYEHARAPFSGVSLTAADAVLALRERVHQEAGFTLTSMDGKTYSLSGLRGKIVLLNFWATWCPPCRKEMPDMEALYQRFKEKGLVVLAVSDEDRETVAGFLAKQNYTFPVLLDPGRKANDAFSVEGIPKSFIFDAEGRLVAQAIDMRTERQFLDLLKEAGLQ